VSASQRHKLSFVIPAHNEEALLGATLATLRRSADAVGEPFELIVVDDASTDGTAAIGRSLEATVLRVDLRHIGAVRNAGARVARGDVLVFVDADTLVPPDTLASVVRALRRGVAGGGARVRLDAGAPPWASALWAALSVYFRLQLAAGCFLFARRAVGGFDEQYFATEEIHLSRALRARAPWVIVPEAVTTSSRKFLAVSVWQFLREVAVTASGGWGSFKQRHGWWYGRQRERSTRDASEPATKR
jgi:glycosyltransferase involved in cell wall biosynthesis